VGGPRSALAVVAVQQSIVRPPGVVIGTDVTERITVIVAAPLDVEAVVAGIEITRIEVHTTVLLGSDTGVEWLYERWAGSRSAGLHPEGRRESLRS
jgi:hypothetical protein